MKFLSFILRIIRCTYPYVRPIFLKNTRLLVALGIASILLGFLPAIKSGIESNFLYEADRLVRSGKITNAASVFDHPFDMVSTKGFIENLPNRITNHLLLWMVLCIYPAAILLTFIFEYIAARIKASFEKDIFTELRYRALEKALRLNPSDLPETLNESGSMANSIQIGTGNITEVYSFLADLVQYLFLLVTSLIILFGLSYLFGLFFILILVFQLFVSISRARSLKEKRNKLDKDRNNLLAVTDNILDKKEIIVAFEQEERFNEKIKKTTSLFSELTRVLTVKNFLYTSLSKIINETERFTIPLVVLLMCVWVDSKSITNIGGIIFLINLYVRLSIPVLGLLSQYDGVTEKEAISNSFLELMESTPENKKLTVKIDQPTAYPAIFFDRISFTYPGGKPVFEDFTLEIPKGKTTIVIGPSGCGKSTIGKLILNFWKPSEGNIFLMGQNSTTYSDREIHEFCAYLSQGDYIIEDTVRDNANWGMSKVPISDKMLLEALREVKLIADTSDHQILDKYARDLSGGEQQRLSLARIILDESPILILDKPLTGVDVFTAADIYPVFKKILTATERTVVLISHKLSFINFADHVIVLDHKGKIIENGNPAELIKTKGSKLSTLFEAALKEFSIDKHLLADIKEKI